MYHCFEVTTDELPQTKHTPANVSFANEEEIFLLILYALVAQIFKYFYSGFESVLFIHYFPYFERDLEMPINTHSRSSLFGLRWHSDFLLFRSIYFRCFFNFWLFFFFTSFFLLFFSSWILSCHFGLYLRLCSELHFSNSWRVSINICQCIFQYKETVWKLVSALVYLCNRKSNPTNSLQDLSAFDSSTFLLKIDFNHLFIVSINF